MKPLGNFLLNVSFLIYNFVLKSQPFNFFNFMQQSFGKNEIAIGDT